LRMTAPPAARSIVNQDPFRAVDTAKLQALGWAPCVGIREGFHRTLRSLL
jgi:hypothetical protein